MKHVGKSLGCSFALLGALFVLPPGCGPVVESDEPIGSVTEALITTCPAGYNAIIGTAGNDVLDPSDFVGTPDPLLGYCILGHGGNDMITGSALVDYLVGGAGDDTIDGLDGEDRIWGETNNDTLSGGPGVDQIRGGLGNDTISGGDGDETILFGEGGDDTINGDGGNDIIRGHAGMDVLNGGDGNDEVRGGNDADTVFGGSGNDRLFGEGGNDILSGDDGDDILQGGGGIDDLNGGLGNDIMSENGDGGTSLGDDGNDVIVLSAIADGEAGTDACTGPASCELPEPPVFCTSNGGCGTGKRCIRETKVCVVCQSDSECPGGECVPTLGCTSKELFCANGIDDDSDGLIDCADTADCPSTIPECETGIVNFTGLGQWHACVRSDTGQVKCWGRNNACQVAGPQGTTPDIVDGLGPVSQVRSASFHSCALQSDGTVMCWGTRGSLGDGVLPPPDCTGTPVAVTGLSGVTAIAAGGEHSCAVAGGSIYCWGLNDFGQLGDGTQTRALTPVQVVGISNAVAVSARGTHTCARLADSTVRCWGRNHRGQLGNGTSGGFSSTPVAVTGLVSVVRVETGGATACARLQNGQVRCWGDNAFGQLGTGAIGGTTSTPVTVVTLIGARDIDVGTGHACSTRSNGTVLCWGQNNRGQLGIGSTSNTATPTSVGLSGMTAVSVGGAYTCARSLSSAIYCWGANEYGQVSDTLTDVLSPQLKAGIP